MTYFILVDVKKMFLDILSPFPKTRMPMIRGFVNTVLLHTLISTDKDFMEYFMKTRGLEKTSDYRRNGISLQKKS